jgi:hypothetical protein
VIITIISLLSDGADNLATSMIFFRLVHDYRGLSLSYDGFVCVLSYLFTCIKFAISKGLFCPTTYGYNQ